MMATFQRLRRGLAALLLALVAPFAAHADDDPPGRVGRIADLQGAVSIYDAEQGQWIAAPRNRPLTAGDRVATEADGRAELRIGSTTVRVGNGSELEVLRLDDDRVRLQLHSGELALRVRSREVADETEIVTLEAVMRPQRAGHYRVDRIDDTSYVSAWRGEMRIVRNGGGEEAFAIDNGRSVELWLDGPQRTLRHEYGAAVSDAFASWVLAEDGRDERTVANRYVSPEMTGAEDLDRNGRWEQTPDYGPVWVPLAVQAGWAPYRYGHWAWIRPWGWTWVDDAPWGFAPFHYGRWVSYGGRWCWTPGAYVARPVYAPALVAWVGGPHLNVSVSVGGPVLPAVSWVPLAPREVFVPYYRTSPVYVDRVNHRPPGGPRPREPISGPVVYGNQGVPGAVTVVPRDVLLRRQPVARAVVEVRDNPQQPVQRIAPPPPAAEPRPLPVAPGQAARPPVAVNADAAGRGRGRADRGSGRADRDERGDSRADRPDRGGRPDQRDERPDRAARTDPRGERPDSRGDRPDQRGERPDRTDQRGDRPDQRTDRPDRSDRPDRQVLPVRPPAAGETRSAPPPAAGEMRPLPVQPRAAVAPGPAVGPAPPGAQPPPANAAREPARGAPAAAATPAAAARTAERERDAPRERFRDREPRRDAPRPAAAPAEPPPAAVPAAPPRPAAAPAVQPVPQPVAPPPAARQPERAQPRDARADSRDEGRQRTPEARGNPRDREQNR